MEASVEGNARTMVLTEGISSSKAPRSPAAPATGAAVALERTLGQTYIIILG